MTSTDDIALKVLQLLFKRLPDKSRLFECALAAYASSKSFADSAWKVEHLLTGFDELSAAQVERVLGAYKVNGQNRSSFRGMELLLPLLKRWTGKEWTIKDNEVTLPQHAEADTEIPF